MPPVSPQGSRGGLITAVVIFTIGFVASTIFAIYYGVALGKAEEQVKKEQEISKRVYLDTTNTRFTELDQDRNNNPNLKEKTVLAAAIYNSDELAKRILGASVPTTRPADAAIDAADQALATIQSKLPGVSVSDGSLIGAVQGLIAYAQQQEAAASAAHDSQSAAAADAVAKIALANQTLKEAQDAAAKLAQTAQADKDAVQAATTAYEQKLADNSATMDKERSQYNDTLKKAELERQALQNQLDLTNKKLVAVQDKLAGRRVPTEDAVVRQPDAAILTVASDDIVYINLGLGDHVTKGLTFEVYDKHDGVPPLGDGMSDDNMPVGEASIEIQKVLPTSSQCRVTKLEPGKRIVEGDLIANLVYDRNVKYNFIVYGDFNLSGIGQPNAADADTIKALVVRWGGKVQGANPPTDKDIDVDTDFVVMGAEPKVEDIDPNETDVFLIKKHQDQLAAQAQYNAVLNKAREYRIPIMNQNRFLYFCGYYELAAR